MSYESLRNQFDSLAYDITVKGTRLRPQERIDKLNQLRALTGTIMEQVYVSPARKLDPGILRGLREN